jgi:hypothetical protein
MPVWIRRFFAWLLNTPAGAIFPPYRNVISREDCKEGERVELECGHILMLVHNRRASLPCEQCREERRR